MSIVTPEWIEQIETTAKRFRRSYLENENLLLITDELKVAWERIAELEQKLEQAKNAEFGLRTRGRW